MEGRSINAACRHSRLQRIVDHASDHHCGFRCSVHRTASGKRYDRNGLTAAHKSLPFGTKVRVVNAKNGKSVEVVINDRGPKQADRVLDLSPRAARALGIGRHAMAPVTLERID